MQYCNSNNVNGLWFIYLNKIYLVKYSYNISLLPRLAEISRLLPVQCLSNLSKISDKEVRSQKSTLSVIIKAAHPDLKMAKNTASNKFRTIDVDQYNEDNFKDDDNAVVPDKRSGLSASEVEALIQKGNNVDALKAVLSSAPIGNKNQAEKVTFDKKMCHIHL